MGQCAPPPHDRYTGLSGRITCELEAITPLFVAGAEGSWIEKVEIPHKRDRGSSIKDHVHLDFFTVPDPEDQGENQRKAALPASSLRGMVRSVFEAVTNSCFAVFDGKRLSYRLDAARAAELVPGRIEKGEDGKWVLNLLTGSEPLVPGVKPSHPYAASIHLYAPIQGKPVSIRKLDTVIEYLGLHHGDPCWARISQKGIFCSVEELAKEPADLQSPQGQNERIVQGWLCINNQNIENKRKERFFFRTSDNLVGPTYVVLSDTVCSAYKDLIKDYQQRHADRLKLWQEQVKDYSKVLGQGSAATPALSRYMYNQDDLELKEGTLVYAGLNPSSSEPEVLYIAPAAVPRVSFDHTIADLLPHRDPQAPQQPYHRLCDEIDSLCPACRTFGWVHAQKVGEQSDREKVVAYAGRVRFSYAQLIKEPDESTIPEITIAILSSPKPTTTRFYLRPRAGKPQNGLGDAQAGYDGPNMLRGRKFFRHHRRAISKEYQRPRDAGKAGKDDQNRTLHNVRQPGNRFGFTIDFENLHPIELGALLWSLELREGKKQGYHRLGLAKPLGFGSVKIDTVDLELADMEIRYTTVEDDGGRSGMELKTTWIDIFRRAMEEAYEVSHFERLINISDLLTLLSEPPELPIHYPRTSQDPSSEGKNFEWFMGNNRGGRKSPGPRLSLPLASQDTEGLPLLDKYGKEPNG
ncbi:MAG: RAMP superfamily protein [Chloroflexi bacterium ADurb.Bin360]|nr:MAG: RAMP superfamily protein [Chloroflexi bacterium ADurb.Bin360]